MTQFKKVLVVVLMLTMGGLAVPPDAEARHEKPCYMKNHIRYCKSGGEIIIQLPCNRKYKPTDPRWCPLMIAGGR